MLLLCSLPVEKLPGQTVPDDSAIVASDEDGMYYDIAKLRIVRWLREHKREMTKEAFDQIVELLQEAQNFAKQNDYETALLLLDTASEIISSSIAEASGEASDAPEGLGQEKTPPARWNWQPQIVTGVDFWRQNLELGLAGETTSTITSAGNPFTGVRLRADHQRTALGRVESYMLAKASRDYYSGEFELRTLRGNSNSSHWGLENRFDLTRYRDTTGVSNFEYRTALRTGVELFKNFVLLAGDEFRVRRYQHSDEFSATLFSDNWQNLGYAGLQFASGLSTRLRGVYSYATRRYPRSPIDDYVEHRIEASAYQLTATNSSIFLENIWRQRKYVRGDNCDSYRNSYQEEYFRSDFRFGLSSNLSFDTQADFTLRQHDISCEQTPDYFHLTARPRFLVRIWKDWQIGLGYVYVLRVHQKDIIRTTPVTDAASDSERLISYEDYFSHGLSVSLELFHLGNFMLSLTDQYELRTYPNAATNNVPGLGLFTDRKINSILLFLTWKMFPSLELGMLANYDNDQGRQENQSDFQNTIFSLELGYNF